MNGPISVVITAGVSCAVFLGCNLLTGIWPQNNQSTSNAPGALGAVIAAVLAGDLDEATALAVNPDRSSACDVFSDETAEGPEGVKLSNTVAAGTYGPSGHGVTLDGSEDCESDGSNPDAFAGFEIAEDIVAACSDGSTVTLLAGSSGVFRRNQNLGYSAQIFGSFDVRDAQGNVYNGVRCQISLDEQGTLLESHCTDAQGLGLDTDSADVTCEFDTGPT